MTLDRSTRTATPTTTNPLTRMKGTAIMADRSTTTRTTRSSRSSRLGRIAATTALGGLMAGALSLGGAVAANAAAPTDGWARITHLSPDTKSVDVRLTALSGGDVLYELEDITYGQISDYLALDPGTYVVSMVPSGAAADSDPVISQSVTVEEGEPITVAAYGTNDDLKTAVYEDDLENPADGDSRIRVIQASTVAESVDISTSTGIAIAEGAEQGAATGYATVPAGPWTLELSGDATGTADVQLGGGTVNTLLVLDTADGGTTVKAVVDAAAPGTTPQDGVDTGGGWAATHGDDTDAAGIAGGIAAALALGVAVTLVVRRRNAAAVHVTEGTESR
ncbi:uncharacterized protein DUF4397 [Labedella gwakjiensis]|uniref:DUF4397 domain-containing protein n=2 Tax=Labedella gwakjiensis TaxID=390269 RepID=A0A2P8GTF5_9MICO|nr:uncharacterized protein DUF4397 [Labedella gwakjiensis]RUQ84586.1 DUF4397 domain-containing protein [Labedella gwakjiensis]